jgi:hypothetical protein
MARSLTIKHEETVSTTPLLNGFLAFAMLVMLLSAMSWEAEATDTGDVSRTQTVTAPVSARGVE